MTRSMHYHLVGMPVGTGMIVGMGLIVSGGMIAGYGLLPRNIEDQRATAAQIVVAAPEDAPLSWQHWLAALAADVRPRRRAGD